MLSLDNSDDGSTKTSNMDLNGSFGMELGAGELGLNYTMTSSDYGNSDTDNLSGMSFGLNFRREQALWEFSHLLLSRRTI